MSSYQIKGIETEMVSVFQMISLSSDTASGQNKSKQLVKSNTKNAILTLTHLVQILIKVLYGPN